MEECFAGADWYDALSRSCPPAPSWPAASRESPGRRRSPPGGRGRGPQEQTDSGQSWKTNLRNRLNRKNSFTYVDRPT